jgi:4-hydroxy-tetrahydrodipicolinate synthase
LPVFIYNNPATAKIDIAPSLVERLASIPTVAGIKESSGYIDRITRIQSSDGQRLKLFCGQEHLAFPMFCLGVTGWATALANIMPDRCAKLYELAVVRRDLEGALALHQEVAPLAEFIQRRPLAPAIKTALELLGRGTGSPRKPLSPLSEADRGVLVGLLAELEGGAQTERYAGEEAKT